jgi:hypothetical protein
MFKITIRENKGLEALVSISDPDFREDLEILKSSVPFRDREWREAEKHWIIREPEDYAYMIPAIGRAISEYRLQLRMF